MLVGSSLPKTTLYCFHKVLVDPKLVQIALSRAQRRTIYIFPRTFSLGFSGFLNESAGLWILQKAIYWLELKIPFYQNWRIGQNSSKIDPSLFSENLSITFSFLAWSWRARIRSPEEAYSEPCQISKMKRFANVVNVLKVVNYFRETLHLRCLTAFWIRLCPVYFLLLLCVDWKRFLHFLHTTLLG